MCVFVCTLCWQHTLFLSKPSSRFLRYLSKKDLWVLCLFLLFFLKAALFLRVHAARVDACLHSQVALSLPFLIDVIEHLQGGEKLIWTASGIITPSTLNCFLYGFQKRMKPTPTDCIHRCPLLPSPHYPHFPILIGGDFFLSFIWVLFLGRHSLTDDRLPSSTISLLFYHSHLCPFYLIKKTKHKFQSLLAR